MGDAQLWDTPHPCTVGRAPVHPVQQGRGNWEVMGRAAGHGGAPHPQPRGGPSPGTPTPTPFPWLCPRAPHPTDLVPPARATPLVLAAPGGALGHLQPPRDGGLCGEGAEGDLEQLLIPMGSRIWHLHHTRELPAPMSGTGEGNTPHIPCWVLGAPLGLAVQLQCGALPVPPHCWVHEDFGRGPCEGCTLHIPIPGLPIIAPFVLKTPPQSCPSRPRSRAGVEGSPLEQEAGAAGAFPTFYCNSNCGSDKNQGEQEQSCLIPPGHWGFPEGCAPQGFGELGAAWRVGTLRELSMPRGLGFPRS